MNQDKEKSITQFFKSNQKQQNLMEQQSSQKSEAQVVATHNIKISDEPFDPPIDYVFPWNYNTYYSIIVPWLSQNQRGSVEKKAAVTSVF